MDSQVSPPVINQLESSESETLSHTPHELLPRFGRSLGWLLIFLVVFLLAVIVYLIGYGVVLGLQHAAQGIADAQEVQQQIQTHLIHPNGIVGVYLTQCLMLIPLIIIASHFSRQPWRKTLAFHAFSGRILGYWSGVWLIYLVAEYALTQALNIDPGDFMRALNGSKHLPVTLVLVICAPVLEELVFRGYLFKAWRNTRLGLSGTLLLTSTLFTSLHFAQYGWTILALIFALSMILGMAREKSGSIWVPMIIHSLNNLIAVVTVVYLGLL